MHRTILLLAAAFGLAAHTHAQQGFEHSASEIAALMGAGWNLGNTLEAGNNANNFTNKGGLSAETSW